MLKISKADYDLIRWEAERSYPNECCGIILGVESEEHRVVTLTITSTTRVRTLQGPLQHSSGTGGGGT